MANRLELVYSIKELMKEHTDDTLMSDRHILFLFNTYRAKYLRQLYSNRAKELDSSSTQTLCLDMEKVDKGVCGITVDCTVVRSKIKLPDLLSLRGRSALISAGPAIVGTERFEVINADEANICMSDKFATTSVFIEDNYLYVVGNTPASNLIKCIRVTGIFSDPDSLEDFNNCCNCDDKPEPCLTDETDYPIPGHLIPEISKEVLNDFLSTFNVTPSRDTDNDSVPAKQPLPYRKR